MNILMIGASGSGKGTQAKILVEKYGFCHISMGDVLKEQVKLGTETGKMIDDYQKKGELVPLEVTLSALKAKIESVDNKCGILLDGFPRSKEQADRLDLTVDLVLNFKNNLDKLQDRLINRRVCSKCNTNSHKDLLIDGKCPACGGDVYQRSDDNEASIIKRFNFYKSDVAPLADYYKNKGVKVVDIDADSSIKEVSTQIEDSLERI